MEAAGEARGKDSMRGVHVCVCSVQGHEGQAMFRVRVCVLRIAVLFPYTSGWRHSTMIKPKKRDSQTTCFPASSGKQHSRQRQGPREEGGAPLVSGELKEAERCRISKVHHPSPTFNPRFGNLAGIARTLLHACNILEITTLSIPGGAGRIAETNPRISWTERFKVWGDSNVSKWSQLRIRHPLAQGGTSSVMLGFCGFCFVLFSTDN